MRDYDEKMVDHFHRNFKIGDEVDFCFYAPAQHGWTTTTAKIVEVQPDERINSSGWRQYKIEIEDDYVKTFYYQYDGWYYEYKLFAKDDPRNLYEKCEIAKSCGKSARWFDRVIDGPFGGMDRYR